MIIDFRTHDVLPRWTTRAIVVDAETGDRVVLVFFYDSASHKVGRYLDEGGNHPKVDATGKSLVEIWEHRRLRFFVYGDEIDPETGSPLADKPAATREAT